MPRAIWTGAISFGLVNVPVKLYSAVDRKTVRFHQLSGKTGVRVAQKRVDPQTDEEVPYEDIVKGYEIAPERYVRIEPAELDSLEPKKTKTIEIARVVIRSKEQLVAVRTIGIALGMATMLFPDEVLPPERLDEVLEAANT